MRDDTERKQLPGEVVLRRLDTARVNAYEILHLDPRASQALIVDAYHTLATAAKNLGRHELIYDYTRAYSRLSIGEHRRKHDLEFGLTELRETPLVPPYDKWQRKRNAPPPEIIDWDPHVILHLNPSAPSELIHLAYAIRRREMRQRPPSDLSVQAERRMVELAFEKLRDHPHRNIAAVLIANPTHEERSSFRSNGRVSITGRRNERGSPFIKASLRPLDSNAVPTTSIWMMIDTGSPVTVIAPKDFHHLEYSIAGSRVAEGVVRLVTDDPIDCIVIRAALHLRSIDDPEDIQVVTDVYVPTDASSRWSYTSILGLDVLNYLNVQLGTIIDPPVLVYDDSRARHR